MIKTHSKLPLGLNFASAEHVVKSLFRCGSVVAVIFSILCFSAQSWGQSVAVDIKPRRGSLHDIFQLSVQVTGSADSDVPRPEQSDDFDSRYVGPQTAMTIENGNYRVSVTYVFQLIPKRTGTLKTPRFLIAIEGKDEPLEPREVVVTDAPSDYEQSGSVLLSQSIDKQRVFVGEQIVWTIELAARVTVYEASLDETPLPGVWSQPIGAQEQFSRSTGNGRYVVTQMKRALFPLVSGDVRLPARTLTASIEDERRPSLGGSLFSDDLFGGLLGGHTSVRLSTKAENFSVQPLPALPQNFSPADFDSGLVGKTSLSIATGSGPLAIGESRTVEISVRSEGNLNRLSSLTPLFPQGTEVFDLPPKVVSQNVDGRLVTVKTFSLSVSPSRPGTVIIPSVRLGYFNPKDEQFHLATTEPLSFEVTGSAPEEPIVPESPADSSLSGPVGSSYREYSLAERLVRREGAMGMLFWCCTVLIGVAAGIFFVRREKGRNEALGHGKISTAQVSTVSGVRQAFLTYAGIKEETLIPLTLLRANIESLLPSESARREAMLILDVVEDCERRQVPLDGAEAARVAEFFRTLKQQP